MAAKLKEQREESAAAAAESAKRAEMMLQAARHKTEDLEKELAKTRRHLAMARATSKITRQQSPTGGGGGFKNRLVHGQSSGEGGGMWEPDSRVPPGGSIDPATGTILDKNGNPMLDADGNPMRGKKRGKYLMGGAPYARSGENSARPTS